MLPFTSLGAWKGVFVGLSAFPALLASGVFALVGQRSRAASLAAWVRHEWLGLRTEGRGGVRWAVLAISVIAFVVTLYLLVGIGINVGYPLRADAKPTDWGGPSLPGRWAVHAAGGVLFAIVTPSISRALAALGRRMQA